MIARSALRAATRLERDPDYRPLYARAIMRLRRRSERIGRDLGTGFEIELSASAEGPGAWIVIPDDPEDPRSNIYGRYAVL